MGAWRVLGIVASIFLLAPTSEAGTVYSDTILSEPGLLDYWTLHEGSTAEPAGNLVPGRNDGTYTGGVTLRQSSAYPGLGYSATFDGVSGTYVSAGNIDYSGLTDEFSVELWARPDVPMPGYFVMVAKWDELQVFDFHVLNNTFALAIKPGGNLIYPRSGSFTVGEWYHLVATYDGTQSVLYVNGLPVDTELGTGDLGVSSYNLLIGASRTGSGANAFNWLGGLDEVAIYGTALTGTQVLNHYNVALSTVPEPSALILAALLAIGIALRLRARAARDAAR